MKNVTRKKLLLLALIQVVVILLAGCQESEFDERFDPRSKKDPPTTGTATWSFGSGADYTFPSSQIRLPGNKAELLQLDTALDSSDDFTGAAVGVTHDGTVLKLKTSAATALDLDQILPTKTANLVGYWKMNGNWNDSSGAANHGTPNGSPLFSGDAKVGINSGKFNGTNAYIAFTGATLQNSNFTYSAWVRISSLAASGTIFGWSADGGPQVRVGTTGHLSLLKQGTTTIATSSTALATNRWYHIAITNNSTNNWALYINGSLEKSGTHSNSFSFSDMRIGAQGSASVYFSGQLDEVSFWNTSLTASDISAIYASQRANLADDTSLSSEWAPLWSNLVSYWKLDNNYEDATGTLSAGSGQNGVTFSSTIQQVGTHALSISAGPSHYANLGDVSQLNGVGKFTITAWCNFTALNDQNKCISKYFDATNRISIGLSGAGNGTNDDFHFSLSNGTSAAGYSLSNMVRSNSWHHVAMVYDGSQATNTNRLKMFIDGQQYALTFIGTIPSTTSASLAGAPLTVSRNTAGEYMTGHVDEVAVWNVPLNEGQIKMIYERQKQKYSGVYSSPIFDIGTSAPWTMLTPAISQPFLKELPTTNESENPGLVSSLIGLWHFNETTSNTLPASADFSDSTTNANHLSIQGGATPGNFGIFDMGVRLTGSGPYLTGPIASTLIPGGSSALSFSIWVKPTNLTIDRRIITIPRDASSTTLGVVAGRAANKFGVLFRNAADALIEISSTSSFSNGKWYHLAITIETGSVILYVNGVQEASSTAADFSRSLTSSATAPVAFAAGPGGANNTYGLLDEAAMWNRTLSDTEVKKIYRRGASRVKYNVRSCPEAECNCSSLGTNGTSTDCSGDGTANDLTNSDPLQALDNNWLGPGGTPATTFSELQNNSSVDTTGRPTGTVGITGTKVFDWTTNFYQNQAKPANNRYFQYRVLVESEDESLTCSGAPCSPELSNLTVSPTGRYFAGAPSIVNNTGTSYSSLTSFQVSRAGSCMPTYQLSNNGTNYYYWSGSAWVAATGYAQSNFEGDVSTNIRSFPAGSLFFRAYLPSDLSQSCEIQSITVGYQ